MGRWILSYQDCGLNMTCRFETLDQMFSFIEFAKLPRFKAKRI